MLPNTTVFFTDFVSDHFPPTCAGNQIGKPIGVVASVMPEYYADELDRAQNARTIQTAVAPRPIAWISSQDAAGNPNLAPFSSYNYVSTHPPVLVFNSPAESTGRLKDTARNALETEEFAINVVTADLIEAMDETSARLEPEESEFEFAGLETAPCETIEAPRLADAPVTMECTLFDTQDVYQKLMIFGEVQYYHIDDDVLTDGKLDSQKLTTVARLGGPYYATGEPIDFERQF